MTLQPITHQGRTLAVCTRERVFLSGELEALAPDDPVRLLVLGMCLYAGEILNGLRPGPYRDTEARAHARRHVIPSGMLEHPDLRDDDEPGGPTETAGATVNAGPRGRAGRRSDDARVRLTPRRQKLGAATERMPRPPSASGAGPGARAAHTGATDHE